MIFDYFKTNMSQEGQVCSESVFFNEINDSSLISLCKKIAKEEDHDKQNILKRKLPCITWVASFGGKSRKTEFAKPSGLYMMDVDGVESPEKIWEHIKEKGTEELGILIAHKTPSTHGLRIVALNREGLDSVEANMKWFANCFPDIEFDMVVKDLARCSYLVPGSYFYYTDTKIFRENFPVYIKKGGESSEGNVEDGVNFLLDKDCGSYERYGLSWFCVKRNSDLFGNEGEIFNDTDLKHADLDVREIGLQWLRLHGGIPEKGSRNATLFSLAVNLRYLCDFQSDMLLACLPALLPHQEMCSIVASALKRDRIVGIPKEMREAIATLKQDKKTEDGDDEEDSIYNHIQTSYDMMPTEKLPPVFKQFVGCAPQDFRKATVVALLPMLGTLGSRLRGRYLDGKLHSPSFQCEIEAPMASGKSFTRDIYNVIMDDLEKKEATMRVKEMEYEEKVRQAKNAKEQPPKEAYPIRLVGSRVSISAIVKRIYNAQGLHVFSFDEEVRNVLDGMKAGGFGDVRAILRNAFDNSLFGQEYNSDQSVKMRVNVMWNTLHCGTPAEYKKLYNNAEDGTITRILFADIPDQRFKKMPVFKKLNWFGIKEVKKQVQRLSDLSMKDNVVQPEHELKDIGFLNEWAEKWLERMRVLALRFENDSLDVYRRRAAVVGFRAGMVAWFLFGKNTLVNQLKTCDFAEMVAEQMCVTLMQRFEVSQISNVIRYKKVWNRLGDTFTLSDLSDIEQSLFVKTPARSIIFLWKQKNLIEKININEYRKIRK